MTGKMTGHQLFKLKIELSALLEDNSAKTQIGTATHLSSKLQVGDIYDYFLLCHY